MLVAIDVTWARQAARNQKARVLTLVMAVLAASTTSRMLAHLLGMSVHHENRSQPFISKRLDFLVARSEVDIAKTISVGDKFLGGPSVILIDLL